MSRLIFGETECLREVRGQRGLAIEPIIEGGGGGTERPFDCDEQYIGVSSEGWWSYPFQGDSSYKSTTRKFSLPALVLDGLLPALCLSVSNEDPCYPCEPTLSAHITFDYCASVTSNSVCPRVSFDVSTLGGSRFAAGGGRLTTVSGGTYSATYSEMLYAKMPPIAVGDSESFCVYIDTNCSDPEELGMSNFCMEMQVICT